MLRLVFASRFVLVSIFVFAAILFSDLSMAFPDSFARREPSFCVPGVGQQICGGFDLDCDNIAESCESWVELPGYAPSGVDRGEINATWGLTGDRQGNLYASGDDGRLSVFDSNGVFRRNIGRPGSGPGELNVPWRAAVDADGNVYVSDRGNNRIQKFDPEGEFLLEISDPGGPGELFSLHGIGVDSQGFIYVLESRDDHVIKFDPAGNFVTRWGSDDGPGALGFAVDLAVGPDDSIYVAEFIEGRVFRYDPDGTFLNEIGSGWQLQSPIGVWVDEENVVYVVDWAPKVRTYSSDGTPLDVFYAPSNGPGSTDYFYDIVAGPAGTVFVTGDVDVLQYDLDGNLISRFGRPEFDPDEYYGASDLVVGELGSTYLLDRLQSKVLRFDSERQFVTSWRVPVDLALADIRTGPDEEVFVADRQIANWIFRFSATGQLLAQWGGPGSGLSINGGMTVGVDGFVYISERSTESVFKFDRSGILIDQWPIGNGTTTVYGGQIGISPNGEFYCFNSYDDSFAVHDPDGNFLRRLEAESVGHVSSIQFANDGTFYVQDSDRIVHLDADGELLRVVSDRNLRGLAIDRFGFLHSMDLDAREVVILGCPQRRFWYEDSDGDGHGNRAESILTCGPLQGYSESGGDCDDRDSGIHPGETELCDGFDNDCDRAIDDSFPGEHARCQQFEDLRIAQCVSGEIQCNSTDLSDSTNSNESTGITGHPIRDTVPEFADWLTHFGTPPTSPIVDGGETFLDRPTPTCPVSVSQRTDRRQTSRCPD